MDLIRRPRRNRKSEKIREAVAETSWSSKKLIQPIFIADETSDIKSMPGQKRFSLTDFEGFCKNKLVNADIMGVVLFAAVKESKKTKDAKEALNPKGLLPESARIVKEFCPDLEVITDVALDPFSSDGHDGLVENGKILNDDTVDILTEMALIHAKAGADWVGPSDMMDGRVKAIREKLDLNGYKDTSIMSYTAKYASHFYGPFRDALDSAPKSGDKKTYQMDPRNVKEALLELEEDLLEGADAVMVKPALSYLDVISKIKENSSVPVVAYNVSGEYSMVKAAHEKGLINGDLVQKEILTSIFRAGADIVITYSALEHL